MIGYPSIIKYSLCASSRRKTQRQHCQMYKKALYSDAIPHEFDKQLTNPEEVLRADEAKYSQQEDIFLGQMWRQTV